MERHLNKKRRSVTYPLVVDEDVRPMEYSHREKQRQQQFDSHRRDFQRERIAGVARLRDGQESPPMIHRCHTPGLSRDAPHLGRPNLPPLSPSKHSTSPTTSPNARSTRSSSDSAESIGFVYLSEPDDRMSPHPSRPPHHCRKKCLSLLELSQLQDRTAMQHPRTCSAPSSPCPTSYSSGHLASIRLPPIDPSLISNSGKKALAELQAMTSLRPPRQYDVIPRIGESRNALDISDE